MSFSYALVVSGYCHNRDYPWEEDEHHMDYLPANAISLK